MNQQFMKPIEILLVEDNPGDVELILIALEDLKLRNNVHAVDNGQKAIDFMYKQNEFKLAPTPDIILLDINLPVINGLEVLKKIKSDDMLKHIPILILTTSEADKDVLEAYKEHANAYLNKPVDYHQFIDIIKSIEQFWFVLVKLPVNRSDINE